MFVGSIKTIIGHTEGSKFNDKMPRVVVCTLTLYQSRWHSGIAESTPSDATQDYSA